MKDKFVNYIYSVSLNKKEYIEIHTPIPWSEVKIFYDVRLVLKNKKQRLVIGEDIAIGLIEDLMCAVQEAIKKERILDHTCICQGNVGLQSVKSSYDLMVGNQVVIDANATCVHQGYSVCGFKNSRATFVYNDQFGNIILEITPWFSVYRYENKDVFPKWVKQYKPILRRYVKPEVAQILVEQLQLLLAMVRKNSGLNEM
jgi:hypothetical protein